MKAGFYLEAIALLDSVITDRLESILAQARKGTRDFRGLANAIDEVRSLKLDLGDDTLFEDLTAWKDQRNRWLHEFAKVSLEDNKTIGERHEAIRDIAREGKKLATRLKSFEKKAQPVLKERTR